jgi:hypothetical protein
MALFQQNRKFVCFCAKLSVLVLVAVSSTCLIVPAAAALTGRQIMEKVDAWDPGDTMVAEQEWTLIDKNDYRRYRRTKAFLKKTDKGTQGIMFFLSPADVEGTGFLVHDHGSGEKDNDQWLYLPALHKTKRIASSDRSAAFMGSDLTYADMGRFVIDDWNYTLLKEDRVEGINVWIIEAIPVSQDAVERYDCIKSELFVRQDIPIVIKALYWIDKGRKLKYFEVSKLEQINSIWVSTEIHAKTTQGKETLHQTILKLNNVKINVNLDEAMFSVRQLERGPWADFGG